MHSFTAEETKEAFDVARNSIELLSTILSSSPHQEALQVIKTLISMLSCLNCWTVESVDMSYIIFLLLSTVHLTSNTSSGTVLCFSK